MAYKKGGLAHFATGGSTTEPDTSTDSKDTVVPVKENITIGGAKVPLRTAISGEVLKNLEDEVARRTTGFGGFMNPIMGGFERAIAMTSQNPGAAMAEVGAKQRNEQQDLINMRTNIASIRAAQERAKADAAQWGAMNNQGNIGGAGQGNIGGAGQGNIGGAGQGNTGTVGGTGGVFISPEQKAIEASLQYPEDKIEARNKYLNAINNANARGQAEASGNTQQEYKDPRTGAIIGYFTPNQVKSNPGLIGNAVPTGVVAGNNTAPAARSKPGMNFTPTGNSSFDNALSFVFGQEGGYKDVDGNTGAPVNMGINQKHNPDIDVKNLTPDQARNIYKARYWDVIGADKLDPIAAKIAFDAAVNQGPEYAKRLIAETGGDPEKMMAHRLGRYAETVAGDKNQTGNLKGWMGRLEALRGELAQPKTERSTDVTTSTTPGLSPIEQHQIDVKKAENAASAQKVGLEEQERKAADYMAAIQSGRKDLPTILSAAQNIQHHADKNAGAFFYPGQGGILGGATSLPVIGEGVGDVYASLAGDAKARAEIGQASKALGVENAKNLFAGMAARFGAQLTGIGTSSKGVGLDLPAETNKFNARMMELTAQMADDQAAAFEKYKGGNAFQFLNSPENKDIEARYLGALQREFPNRIKLNTKPPAEPKVGDVIGNHRFKGGDASKKENWEKV